MHGWKLLQRLGGETAREIGILILVFAPLEATFSERPVSTTVIIGLVVLGIIGIVGGILMEVRGAN